MFIMDKKPKSITAEAYRVLRTNIQYSSFDSEYLPTFLSSDIRSAVKLVI